MFSDKAKHRGTTHHHLVCVFVGGSYHHTFFEHPTTSLAWLLKLCDEYDTLLSSLTRFQIFLLVDLCKDHHTLFELYHTFTSQHFALCCNVLLIQTFNS